MGADSTGWHSKLSEDRSPAQSTYELSPVAGTPSAYLGALLSLQHVAHFRPPLQGDTARSRGTLALSPHAACSLKAALFQSPPGRAQMQDEQTVQGGTEGMVPGASKGGHTCRGSAVPSRT